MKYSVKKLYDLVEDNLPGGNFNALKKTGRKFYDSFTPENLKKAGIATLATVLLGTASAGSGGCTLVDSKRFRIHDACRYHHIKSTTFTKEEEKALVNLDKVWDIERAIQDYLDPEDKLSARQLEYLGIKSTYGMSEFDIYLTAIRKLEQFDKENKALTDIKDETLKQKIWGYEHLGRKFESIAQQTKKKIMDYAVDEAKKIIKDSLVCGELFTGTPLNESYSSLQDIINKFSGEHKQELADYAEDIYKKVKSGELKPTIVDRIFREIFAIPYGILRGQPFRGLWTSAPFIEHAGIGAKLGEENITGRLVTGQPKVAGKRLANKYKDQGVVWGTVETLIDLGYFLLPFWRPSKDKDEAVYPGGEGGRGDRTGGDDVGGGRDKRGP